MGGLDLNWNRPVTQDKDLFTNLKETSWQNAGRIFILADILYGAAGIVGGNPAQAVSAMSGVITNSFIAHWGHLDGNATQETPMTERIINPAQYPVESVSFWNIVRSTALVAGGAITAVQQGNVAEGVSLATSGAIDLSSNTIILNRKPLATLGAKIAETEQTPLNSWRTNIRNALEHSSNAASILSFPSVIAMVSAGLTAHDMTTRVLLLSGAAADIAGTTLRSLCPPVTVNDGRPAPILPDTATPQSRHAPPSHRP